MSMRVPALEGKLIAFFHQSSDLYGSDKVLLSLAEGVQKSGGRAVVVLPDKGPLTQEFALRDIEFHVLPVIKLSRARYGPRGIFDLMGETLGARASYDRVFGKRRVDLVHSNTVAAIGGALWARGRKIPHLWHVHEIIEHPLIAARMFPFLLDMLADRIVCNSKATYQWLVRRRPHLKTRTGVVLNSVCEPAPAPVDNEAAQQLHRQFRPSGTRLAIGLVGRINRMKGHALLLDAVDLLHSRGVADFSVVFVGSSPPGQGQWEAELKARVARSPLRERIVFRSFERDVWAAYAALDIVCVPSTEPESFGLVAVEAMAMGKPTLVSRLGGLQEIVVDEATGLMFNPRSPEEFAAALERLLLDDKLRARLGQAGKRRFDAEFSAPRMFDRFVLAYAETMGAAR